MNKKNIVKIMSLLLIFTGLAISCVDDSFDVPDVSITDPNLTANATIADVKALYTGNLIQITDDKIIEGYVISSDKAGGFYKTISIQDNPTNPTGGIQIDIDLSNYYTQLPIGSKVYVKVKDLFIDKYRGVFKLGSTYVATNGSTRLGRIAPHNVAKHIFRSADIPVTITPVELTSLANIDPKYINTLVTFKNVEFDVQDLCTTYADKKDGANTNKTIRDSNRKRISLRSSGYADFANFKIPSGNGDITAVLSIFESGSTTSDDFQLYIRDTNDVKFTNNRFDGSNPSCTSPAANTTVKQLKELMTNGLTQITTDVIVEAVIVATDGSRNLYKTIYVQDDTGGIKVRINQTSLEDKGYIVGKTITIKAKDLYINALNDEIQLGGLYNNNLGNIDRNNVYKHLFVHNESNNVIQPKVIGITDVSADLVGSLVRFENVQFSSEAAAENFVVGGSSTNHALKNCNDDAIIVRTSSFANFANVPVPDDNGDLTGILGIYNGVYQIWLRTSFDVHFDKERCGDPVPVVLLNEDFQTATDNTDLDFTGWTNFAEAGGRKWSEQVFRGNGYTEFSAFRSNDVSNIGWLISPAIDMDKYTNEQLTFKTAQHHVTDANNKLEVFVSTNFDGSNVTAATWIPISATLATMSDSWYRFINSGTIDISSYTGNLYVAFKYTGSGTDTNLDGGYFVDDVKVTGTP